MKFWMTNDNTPLPSWLTLDTIESRVDELNRFIANCHKDSSVESSIKWANAVRERDRLNRFCSKNHSVQVDVNAH